MNGIGERIKFIRKENRLSQTAFGEKLGASRDVISNLEVGRVIPNQITTNLICTTFGINKKWLETGEGEIYEISLDDDVLTRAFAEISLSDDQRIKNIVAKLNKLDDKYIDSINALIDGLIK